MKKIVIVSSIVIAGAFVSSSVTQAAPAPAPSNASLGRQIKAVQDALSAMNLKPGPQGIQGLQGERGAQGIQGPAGSNGGNGERGATGERGAAGERGPAGLQGPAGTNGADGRGFPSNTLVLIGGDCPSGTTVQGTAYQWRVYSGNPFTGVGSELWVSACRIN